MLERFTARARHIAIAFGTSVLAVAVPWLADHQADVTLWIVGRVPTWVAPLIPTAFVWFFLEVTPLTRQYGVGSAPAAAVEPDQPLD